MRKLGDLESRSINIDTPRLLSLLCTLSSIGLVRGASSIDRERLGSFHYETLLCYFVIRETLLEAQR